MASNIKQFDGVSSNDHDIFKEFRRNNRSLNLVTRSLIDVHENNIFLFDISTGLILISECSSFWDSCLPQRKNKGWQALQPDKSIIGCVFLLRVSKSGQLAVVTTTNVYVMTVLQPPAVKTIPVLSWWRDSEEHIRVRQGRWHPQWDSILFVLTDNVLLVFDVNSETMLKTISLKQHCLHFTHAMDFDFLPKSDSCEEEQMKLPALKTSLIVIKANGDLLRIILPDRIEQITVIPNPPFSGCALIVLDCPAPVVVFSEEDTGTVYHTFMTESGQNPVLKTFEQYSLDTGVTSTNHRKDSIKFIKDSLSKYKYFVVCDSGVHGVLLPIVETIRIFLTSNILKETDNLKLQDAINSTKSEFKTVCHTMLPDSTTPWPIYGIALVPKDFATFQIIILKADATTDDYFMHDIFPTEDLLLNKANIIESMKVSKRVELVTNFLQDARNKRPCITDVINEMRSKPKKEAGMVFLETVAKMRQHGTEELAFINHTLFLDKYLLFTNFNQQLNEIEKISMKKEELRSNAERIAEKYEEINDKQVGMMERAKWIGVRIGRFYSIEDQKQRQEVIEGQNKVHELKTRYEELVHKINVVKEPKLKGAGDQHINISKNRKKILLKLTEMTNIIQELRTKLVVMDSAVTQTIKELQETL